MFKKIKFVFILLGWGIAFLSLDGLAMAVTQTQITSGLQAAIGISIDEVRNQLYFVEYNPPGNGKLKRVDLPPQCGTPSTPSCSSTVTVIADSFRHPEDVQLDLDQGLAYVTTRDDPGTTGVLWRVDIATGTKTMVTFNLGEPQQFVLDTSNDAAYVVGYVDGRLRRVDLTTGVKVPVFVGLDHPVGIVVTTDGNTAYVTEQGPPARVTEIDLTAGVKVGEVVRDGVAGVSLISPFFLAWTDGSRNSLYVVERDPANRVARVDLTTTTPAHSLDIKQPFPEEN